MLRRGHLEKTQAPGEAKGRQEAHEGGGERGDSSGRISCGVTGGLIVRGYAKLFLAATLIALCCRLFLVEAYRIVSESMAPGLLGGDLVFVSKFDFNLRLPF